MRLYLALHVTAAMLLATNSVWGGAPDSLVQEETTAHIDALPSRRLGVEVGVAGELGTTAAVAPTGSTNRAVGSRSKQTQSAKSSTGTATTSSLCAKPRVVITEVDVGVAIDSNEDEAALKLVAIAALPSGGSRIAFHSGDGTVIVRELDAKDQLVSSSAAVEVPMHDFADIHADDKGFVLLGTRDAEGGGTLNCGNPRNLCGSAPDPAVPCYDMYLARFDGSSEKWATKLTSSSASLPPADISSSWRRLFSSFTRYPRWPQRHCCSGANRPCISGLCGGSGS